MDRIPANKLSPFDVYRFQLCCVCGGSMRLGESLRWDGFVVKDSVWQIEAALDRDAGAAHMVCLQNRIQRQLIPEDFIDCPLTRGYLGADSRTWFGPPLGEIPDCRGFIGPLYGIRGGKPDLADYVSAFDSPTGEKVGRQFLREDGSSYVSFGDTPEEQFEGPYEPGTRFIVGISPQVPYYV